MTEVIFNLNQIEREAYTQNVKDRAILHKLNSNRGDGKMVQQL